MTNYKKEVLRLYPKSKLMTSDGVETVFVQGEDADHGIALVKPWHSDPEMTPWEQCYNVILAASESEKSECLLGIHNE